MTRVTRAAARADQVLADETSTVAEAALAEDPENIELPSSSASSSAEKASERPPLGEIKINDQGGTTAAFSSPPEIEEDHGRDGGVSSQSSSSTSDNENRVVLVLGEKTKTPRKAKKGGKGSASGKKSTKKAKGPSPEVVEQMRQTVQNNVGALKGTGKKAKKVKTITGEKKVTEDAEVAILSDSSSEAADLLRRKEGNLEPEISDDWTPTISSPAINAVRQQLGVDAIEEASKANTATKLAVVKEPTNTKDSDSSDMSSTKANDSDEPSAVKKLAMVFQEQPESSPTKSVGRASLADIVSRESLPAQDSTNKTAENAPETLRDLVAEPKADEKSDHLPAAEASTKMVVKTIKSNKSNPTKPTASTSSKKVATATASTRNVAKKVTMGKGEVKITSPTDQMIQDKRQTKPTTKSAFQLSSETTSAKLKAQREERQKRREEEEKARREQKSKPISVRAKPAEVKSTAASRARLSLAAEKYKGEKDVAKSGTTLAKKTSMVAAKNVSGTTRRLTAMSVQPNGSPIKEQVKASPATPQEKHEKPTGKCTVSTAPRLSTFARSSRTVNSTPKEGRVPSSVRPPRPSVAATAPRASLAPKLQTGSTTSKRASTNGTSVATKPAIRVKETIDRGRTESRAPERTTKAKMDPASKARAEAAERGRAASKAWAEQQKKKTTDASKLKETVTGVVTEGSTSSDCCEQEASAAGVELSGEDKENEAPAAPPATGQPESTHAHGQVSESATCSASTGSMAMGILSSNNDIAQEEAAYIVAETRRINKAMRT